MADPKQILQEVVDKMKKAKAEEDSVRQKKNDDDRNKILENVSADLAKSLEPVLERLATNSQVNEEQIRNALSEAISMNMPEIDTSGIAQAVQESIANAFAGLTFPEPKVNVQVPEFKMPEMKFPETKFPERMSVGLENYSNKTPMPVMMVDTKGNPFVFSFPSGGAGGKHDFLTIKGFSQSAFSEITNPDGRVKVELPTGSSGLTDTELRATSVPISQVSGVAFSTNVVDAFGSTAVNSVFNADNRIRVSVETGGSGLTDAELRATAVPVTQVSGASWSTEASIVAITDIFSTTAASTVVNPDNRVRVELPAGASGLTDAELRAAHIDVQQVSGATDSVNVVSTVGLTNTEIRAASLPVEQVSGSSWSTNVLTMPAVVVTSITNTIAAANVDSTGVQYSGSNPLPITVISGALTSTIVVGSVVADAVDDGSAPLKGGGIGRTANPTAVANGDIVTSTHDDLGRQVMRPIQVRDLTLTAYVSVTNGTETTLRAAIAGACLDMVMLKLGNTSDAAVSVDIRAVTAGSIVDTVVVPPYGTAGYSSSLPYPQSEQGNNWTLDLPDITGTTVYATALFSQEV